jgi:AcrR family transcriptional regulator
MGKRKSMPTPARTSIQEIVAAGRQVIGTEGLDGLTMQRVAALVGVRAPSLYKRVDDRATLVRLVLEDVIRELTEALDAAADTGDPRRDLVAIAHAFRRFAHAQPRAYGLLFTRLPAGEQPEPELLARASSAIIRSAGALAGPDDALSAARTVVAWAQGFVSIELAGGFQLGGDVADAFDYGIERVTRALAAEG